MNWIHLLVIPTSEADICRTAWVLCPIINKSLNIALCYLKCLRFGDTFGLQATYRPDRKQIILILKSWINLQEFTWMTSPFVSYRSDLWFTKRIVIRAQFWWINDWCTTMENVEQKITGYQKRVVVTAKPILCFGRIRLFDTRAKRLVTKYQNTNKTV